MVASRSQHAPTSGRARQIEVPPAARALCTLSRIDYEDAFLIETALAQDRTGEQWARSIVEAAPRIVRRKLRRGWFAHGLKLGSARSDRFVLGWEVRDSTPDYVLLGASSRLGMPAELLFARQADAVLVATVVQEQNPIVRAMWAGVGPVHRQVVPYLLERAVREAPRADRR